MLLGEVSRASAAASALGVEFLEVARGRDAAHVRLSIECAVWPTQVVAVREGLQAGLPRN